jgi:uncharacterized protein (TIGR00299 family) protein
MKILYCDCFSGISGDMFLAAMVDAGLPEDYLFGQLSRLNLHEFKGIKTSKVLKGALMATLIEFDLAEYEHHHEHENESESHHGNARHLADILGLIDASALPTQVKQTASAIFQKLGIAEAKIHGTSLEEVHFHEVGAVDSILDIVGAAVALDYFHIDRIFASAIPLGTGTVQTQHGLLPIPAPATLELLTAAKARVIPSEATQELVTPTGAAILATLAEFEQPAMQLDNVGLGAGHRELPWPNVLRLIIGERVDSQATHVEIEANIDDMNPQFYASVMQHLFAQGAKDVYFTPIQMKKNRPAVKLSVIATVKDEAALAQVILRETSTMGVRVKELQRHEAIRETHKINTCYGEVSVKLKRLEGKVVQANPEYEDCLVLAERLHLPVAEVYREALCVASNFLTE